MAAPVAFTFKLVGDVAFITGASKGIGTAIAMSLTNAGVMALCLVARDEAGLRETERACKDARADVRVLVLCADVTNDEQLLAAIAACKDTFGRITIAVLNAGITLNTSAVFGVCAVPAACPLRACCVPACLRACVPACLRACVPACLRACMPVACLLRARCVPAACPLRACCVPAACLRA
jgi:hypothetical protein